MYSCKLIIAETPEVTDVPEKKFDYVNGSVGG